MSVGEEGGLPRPTVNRAARRAAGMRKPLDEPVGSAAGQEVGRGLAQLFKGREEKYVPVTKSLGQIGLEPRIMDIMIGDQPVQCFVIPCQELVYKEWQHMTGGEFTSTAVGEEQKDDR